jgi:hypothetical protein
MQNWTPAAMGSSYDLTPTLMPLAPFKDKFSVVSGLVCDKANPNGDGPGDHARAMSAYLTGTQPRKTEGANLKLGRSADQAAADKIGHLTRFRSLEFGIEEGQQVGRCDSGYSCAYSHTISWRSDTTPLVKDCSPKSIFDRMFANGDPLESAEMRARREANRKSILDYVLEDTHRLEGRLGSEDRRKLDEYLTAVRDLERRIERAAKFPTPAAPDGAHAPEMFETYEQHMQLMYEVLALAFQTDSTRIGTFIVAHDGSNRPYPTIGIRDGHHDLSHHRDDEEKKKKLAQINRYHVTQFARFLDRLKSIKEGDGTLLDNCTIQYGSALSNGNAHSPENLPILLAGGGGGALSTGRHLRVDEKTPMTNLYRSMLDNVGVHTEKIGDSTGKLETLFGG